MGLCSEWKPLELQVDAIASSVSRLACLSDSSRLIKRFARLFAFCTMCTLYITLFFFLRRSDTIETAARRPKLHSIWMTSLKEIAGRRCKDAQAVAPDLPPWERLELDFSGVVLLPPPPLKTAERKSSIVSVISLITRSPVRKANGFNATLPTTGPVYQDPFDANNDHKRALTGSGVWHGLNVRFPADNDNGYPASVKSSKDAESEETLDDFLKQDKETFVPTQIIQELVSSQAIVESASAYFNHQASLLMFWFPIAYLFTLTPSLVRLFTEMATGRQHRTLRLIANLATISLGLQDVFIFGIVEWTIKRRVRQRLPDHL